MESSSVCIRPKQVYPRSMHQRMRGPFTDRPYCWSTGAGERVANPSFALFNRYWHFSLPQFGSTIPSKNPPDSLFCFMDYWFWLGENQWTPSDIHHHKGPNQAGKSCVVPCYLFHLRTFSNSGILISRICYQLYCKIKTCRQAWIYQSHNEGTWLWKSQKGVLFLQSGCHHYALSVC